MIEYRCNDGYEMVGSNFSECMADGSWSFEPPQCFSKFIQFSKPDTVLQQMRGNLLTVNSDLCTNVSSQPN